MYADFTYLEEEIIIILLFWKLMTQMLCREKGFRRKIALNFGN